MSDEYLAHIAGDREQTLREHSVNTAKYAADCLKAVGMYECAYLAGLIHDMGKSKSDFLKYLRKMSEDPKSIKRGSVNHSFAGVRYILERWHSGNELGYPEICAEILAAACGSHHGLFDCFGKNCENGFIHRLEKTDINYEESAENYISQCISEKELDLHFKNSAAEMMPVLQKIYEMSSSAADPEEADREMYFYTGLLVRLLSSALMEGDRRDTAEFMRGIDLPSPASDMRQTWNDCLHRAEARLESLSSDSDINRARREISDRCAVFAENRGGVYRLNVPTGSGKTLSSLRYALHHAAKWQKSRIIFTAPLLTIIEQNAAEIRKYVGDDSLITEHHSNVIRPEEGNEQLDELEFFTESWSSCIIITSLVQLLNTLFDGKTGSVRRFHSLCNSVIVIDEVQTVPPKMLTFFNLAVNFLSEICNATVILCSATQPALEQTEHSLLNQPESIVPYSERLWAAFERTEIIDAGVLRLDEIPDMIRETMNEADSLLVVCNKKDEAEKLFRSMRCAEWKCFHLSAAMCTAHRRRTLERLKYELSGGEKTLCISTQVIEAGVDISFQRVIRFSAGMDSIVQSAGRCNRNGESKEKVPVKIVECADERLKKLHEIRASKKATEKLLYAFSQDPDQFDRNLSSDKSISFYYRCLYTGMEEDAQDYPADSIGTTLFDLLSRNDKYADAEKPYANDFFLRQAFKSAGSIFNVFDDNTTDVIVPYGKGKEIREELIKAERIYDYAAVEKLFNEARAYTVSVRGYQFRELEKSGALVALLNGGAYALCDGFYDEETGFNINPEIINDLWEV